MLYTLFPGEGYERLTAGINVPYSSEYSTRESNTGLLDSLTRFKPRGGAPGEVLDQLPEPTDEWYSAGRLNSTGVDQLSKALTTSTFRPTLSAAIGIQDIWPWLVVLCGTAFFADVFVRRVAASTWAIVGSFAFLISIFLLVALVCSMFFDSSMGEASTFNWPIVALVLALLTVYLSFYLSFFVTSDWFREKAHSAYAKLRRKEIARPQASLSRLQSRKAEIEHEIETRRAATKFAPSGDENMSGKKKLEEVLASEIEKTPALPPKLKRDKLDIDQDNSYTSRLLDAKRKVQQQRDRGKKPDDES